MEKRNVKISTSINGTGKVIVDGIDMSNYVSNVNVDISPLSVPLVHLTIKAINGVELELEKANIDCDRDYIKHCGCCGCEIDIRHDHYYKVFLHEDYYCEMHEMVGRDIDEDKLR